MLQTSWGWVGEGIDSLSLSLSLCVCVCVCVCVFRGRSRFHQVVVLPVSGCFTGVGWTKSKPRVLTCAIDRGYK